MQKTLPTTDKLLMFHRTWRLTQEESYLARREGSTTTATALRVGVAPFPAAFEQVLNRVVKHRALQERRALAVHDHPDAVHLKDLVALGHVGVQRHGVGEAGAAAPLDADAQPCIQLVLLLHQKFDLFDRIRRKRHNGGHRLYNSIAHLAISHYH